MPDSFFLPQVQNRLKLSVQTKHHVDVELLVNLTPAERSSGSNRAQSRNYGALLPVIKLFSSIDWRNASFSLSLIDLFRMETVFQQKEIRNLDWPSLAESLGDRNPGLVDVKTLENRTQSASFFVKEVNRRVAEDGPARVLIILSASVTFQPGMDMRPVESADHPNLKIYYLRYQPLVSNQRYPAGRPGDSNYTPPTYSRLSDQLESLLKGLNPQHFDFSTTDQFRKAFAAILADIATL